MKENKEKFIILKEKGWTHRRIGLKYGISATRVSQIINGYSHAPKWIRQIVMSRDYHKCAICNSKKNLEVHHINGTRAGHEPDNLVTLCRICHVRVEKQDKAGWKRSKYVPKAKVWKSTCSICKKVVEFKNRKFCSRKCQTYRTPEQLEIIANRLRTRNRIHAKAYYHANKNDATFREKIRKNNRLSYIKHNYRDYMRLRNRRINGTKPSEYRV